jgi:hypothetical protein
MAFVSAVLLKHYQPKLNQEESNFERLRVLGILESNNKPVFECRAKAVSPLSVLKRSIKNTGVSPTSYIISLSHLHTTKEGVPFADPQQEILIDTKKRTATTLSFSRSEHAASKDVNFMGNPHHETSNKENNYFLTQWLKVLIMQGFTAKSQQY